MNGGSPETVELTGIALNGAPIARLLRLLTSVFVENMPPKPSPKLRFDCLYFEV